MSDEVETAAVGGNEHADEEEGDDHGDAEAPEECGHECHQGGEGDEEEQQCGLAHAVGSGLGEWASVSGPGSLDGDGGGGEARAWVGLGDAEGDLLGGRQSEAELCEVFGEGLDELESAIKSLFPLPEVPAGEILTNARQADAVSRALESMDAALEAMSDGCTPDIVLTEAEEAMSALGELTGRSIRQDVTDRIFERFCVGK